MSEDKKNDSILYYLQEKISKENKQKLQERLETETGIKGIGVTEEDLKTAQTIKTAQEISVTSNPLEKPTVPLVFTVDTTKPHPNRAVNNLSETDRDGIEYLRKVNEAKS